MMLLSLLLFEQPALDGAEPTVSKEYQLKAAFLYNFTKFVEWPPHHFADAQRPIIIGVLGANPFGGELEKVVQGRKVNGRDIAIKIAASAEDLGSVDLVFVGAGEEKHLESVIDALRAGGVLTVGESSRFAALGGTINFILEGDKIRFEINVGEAERTGLKLSAQLLKLAAAIRGKT